MDIKNVSLTQEKFFTQTQGESTLIVIEQPNFYDQKLLLELRKKLEQIKFDDNALVYTSKNKTILSELKPWVVMIAYLLFAGASLYFLSKELFIPTALFMLLSIICLAISLGRKPKPSSTLSPERMKQVKELYRYNINAEKHLAQRFQENGRIEQQDYDYLRIEDQFALINLYKKKAWLSRMVQAESTLLDANLDSKLSNIKIDNLRNLAWHTNRFKKKATVILATYITFALVCVAIIMHGTPLDLIDALLVICCLFGLLITCEGIVESSPIKIRQDQLELDSYADVEKLCRARKENCDYIKSVVAEDRPFLKIDWVNMKADKQLLIINNQMTKNFFNK